MSRIKIGVLLFLIGLIAGCGSKPNRIAVSGVILLDGKAIDSCVLVFQSLSTEGSTGSASAIVHDGKFDIPLESGLETGGYGIVLTELQPDLDEYEEARQRNSQSALNAKFIPAKYTVANELRIKIEDDMQPISLDLKSQ